MATLSIESLCIVCRSAGVVIQSEFVAYHSRTRAIFIFLDNIVLVDEINLMPLIAFKMDELMCSSLRIVLVQCIDIFGGIIRYTGFKLWSMQIAIITFDNLRKLKIFTDDISGRERLYLQ